MKIFFIIFLIFFSVHSFASDRKCEVIENYNDGTYSFIDLENIDGIMQNDLGGHHFIVGAQFGTMVVIDITGPSHFQFHGTGTVPIEFKFTNQVTDQKFTIRCF